MENKNELANSRRAFLKKAAYSAPMVVAIGGLALPSVAGASTFTSNTYDATKTKTVSIEEITTQNGTNNVLGGTHTTQPIGAPGSYTLTGSEVKAQVALPNDTWTWVDGVFGGSSNWNGI